ncbi:MULTISPECIES: response regulator transcription factor [Colwelliaceae]|uniref:response regulator transcription factor n=1 Tax=Colwelliaceae TaxID=267889 RepID=UPI000971222A|nr:MULTISPECIES: response regulator transcription factor [Colwelliaceae]
MKILIADDHPLFRQALMGTLKAQFDNMCVLEAESIPQLEEILATNKSIDLVLLDLDIPGAQGFNNLVSIRRNYPELGIIIVSGFEDKQTIHKAMHHGAAGFIPKSTSVPEMISAINDVLDGKLWTPDGEFNVNQKEEGSAADKIASLTPKQHKILLMFADGLLNKQIAYDLGLSESTVKSHASTIFLKLGVRNRTQAVILLNQLKSIGQQF